MAKLLTERVAFSGGTIGGTAEAPVIEGVLLCGAVSANRRRYLTKAFEGERVKRYNGKPVNLNHGRDRDGRPYQEQIGVIQNARHRADGMPIGDIAVNPKKPYAEAFLWDAKHQPKACGMSHVAHCETTRGKDGWEDVTELVAVESVDVIGAGNAATTKGLFEHKGSAVKISLKTFVERFGPQWGAKKWAAATKLVEDMGDLTDVPSVEEPPADAGGGDLKAALMSALAPMLDEAFDSGDSSKLIAALKDFIKLHAKHTGKETPAETPADDGDDDAAEESKKPQPWTVLKECRDADYHPSDTELEILAREPDATKRKTYVTEQKKKAANAKAEKPVAGGRPPGPGGATVKATEAKVPTEAKAFAASIRE